MQVTIYQLGQADPLGTFALLSIPNVTDFITIEEIDYCISYRKFNVAKDEISLYVYPCK